MLFIHFQCIVNFLYYRRSNFCSHNKDNQESLFVPHVLKILDDLDLKITFFIVGQDAALDKNKEMLASIVENGHEVGNHSFHHESWLHRYTKEQVEKEITSAEDVLYKLTSKKPTRKPGLAGACGR